MITRENSYLFIKETLHKGLFYFAEKGGNNGINN